jgi:hypothetical protein
MIRSQLVRAASKAFLAGALFTGPFLVGGCRDVEMVEIPNIFRQAPERPLADVPVPVGFRYKEQGSYIFDRNYRVARLKYTGTPHIDEAIAFFKQQMPLSRWKFVREGSGEMRTVVFDNDLEELTVSLDRDAGLTRIAIDISPRKN